MCNNQRCDGFWVSSICILSSRVKNARQRLANCEPTSTHKHSIQQFWVELVPHMISMPIDKKDVACTYVPQMKELRWWLFFMIMYVAMSMFSPPRSPRAQDGVPYSTVACLNKSSMVTDRLLSLARIAVT